MREIWKNKVGVVVIFFFSILLVSVLVSCGDLTVPEPPPGFDVEAQYKIDSQLIDEYIDKYDIEDVQMTESGLRYKVLEEGEGPYPEKQDIISLHYTLSLLDSSVIRSTIRDVEVKYDLYDSSRAYSSVKYNYPGGPTLGVAEGSKYMKLHDRYLFIVPSKLGFGNAIRYTDHDTLPANTVLVYEVEMIQIR